MKHTVISTKLAQTPGNYSQGRVIEFDDYKILYTSGQTGNDPVSNEVVSSNIQEQTERALLNIKAIVEKAGGTMEDIVKVTPYMKDMKNNKNGFEEIYKTFFPSLKPARSLVEVVEIPLVTE